MAHEAHERGARHPSISHHPVDLHELLSRSVTAAGEFAWHTHIGTDELFLMLYGTLTIQLRDGDGTVSPRPAVRLPRGTEHRPIAHGEVHAMLIEPRGVANTGDTDGPLTARYADTLIDAG